MSARDEMLARIRTANAAAGAGPTGRLVPPVEVQHGDVDLFCENVADYRATVVRTRVGCLLYTSPSPRDRTRSRMPSSA